MKELTSTDHPLIKHLAKLVTDKRYRYEQQRIVIEGMTMVHEALPHTSPYKILATDPAHFPTDFDGEKILVPPRLMEKICATKSPEGLLAEVPMPPAGELKRCHHLLVLDGVADPGNLGTILRTALALGWEGAYLLTGCCDPFNDKCLRAAKGATFRLPLQQGRWEDLKDQIDLKEWQILGADLQGSTSDRISPAKKRILILGSETHGLSEEARALSLPVTIAIQHIDSLNVAVAAGILMSQLRELYNE